MDEIVSNAARCGATGIIEESDATFARLTAAGDALVGLIEAVEVRTQLTLSTQSEEDDSMAAQLNHTIVWSSDQTKSARFLAEMLGRPEPVRFGHFDVVELDNGVSLDFADVEEPVRPQHYAFLISEADFDAVLVRIRERGLEHWADPMRHRPREINHNDGGRGVYFPDPDGHYLEVITRPYGSGGG
jgi:catechol 2,3-dioxygenase-like lactoylglutathione lyase family enzyme